MRTYRSPWGISLPSEHCACSHMMSFWNTLLKHDSVFVTVDAQHMFRAADAYLSFFIVRNTLSCATFPTLRLFHTVTVVSFLLTHFKEKAFCWKWSCFFSPDYHKTFFASSPLINDSVMIFPKASVVSYLCLFFQESLNQMKMVRL